MPLPSLRSSHTYLSVSSTVIGSVDIVWPLMVAYINLVVDIPLRHERSTAGYMELSLYVDTLALGIILPRRCRSKASVGRLIRIALVTILFEVFGRGVFPKHSATATLGGFVLRE